MKQNNPVLRRVVLAPDGLLCYLPYEDSQLHIPASRIILIPTAAVLIDSDILDSRDIKLLWQSHTDNSDADTDWPEPAISAQPGGNISVTLWPGASITLLLSDQPK